MLTAVTPSQVLQEIVSILVGAIQNLGSGIATGVNSFAKSLLMEVDSTGAITGLSSFGAVVAIFAGISLAVGITTLIFNFIKKMGN